MPWWSKREKKIEPYTEDQLVERVRNWHSLGDKETALIFVRAILNRWLPYLEKLPITWDDMQDILYHICLGYGETQKRKGMLLIDCFHSSVKSYCCVHDLPFNVLKDIRPIDMIDMSHGFGFGTYERTGESGTERKAFKLISAENSRK